MTDHSFPYHHHAGFMGVPISDALAQFTVVGLPWDGATTNRPGARLAPAAIRRASHMLCDATHPLWDLSPLPHTTDLGDIALPNTSLLAMRQVLEARAEQLIGQKRHLVWLGGDHSLSLSLLRAYRQHHRAPLALLHFDAHCDTWADHFGEASGHGTWVREAAQEGLISLKHTVQLGLRSAGAAADVAYVANHGGQIYTARQLRGLASDADLAPAVAAIQEQLGQREVYVSFDIDALDPAFAPATGTPEAGGLSSNQALALLELLVPQLNTIGCDLVEVSPPFDHADITSLVASQLVWTYLAATLARHKARGRG